MDLGVLRRPAVGTHPRRAALGGGDRHPRHLGVADVVMACLHASSSARRSRLSGTHGSRPLYRPVALALYAPRARSRLSEERLWPLRVAGAPRSAPHVFVAAAP